MDESTDFAGKRYKAICIFMCVIYSTKNHINDNNEQRN